MDRTSFQSRIWSMNPQQLAEQCRVLAESQSPAVEEAVQAEAKRLYATWLDALDHPGDNYEDHARKASLQAGLRKRTIEILIKVSQKMGE